MSETKLLPCPSCGGENTIETLNEFLPALKCNDCGLMMTIPASFIGNYKKELYKKWNTRKPMKRIAERLENEAEKAMRISEKAAELGNDYEKHMLYQGGKGNAFEEAIEIVKEEGGLDV